MMRSSGDTAFESGLQAGPAGRTVVRVLAEVTGGSQADPDRSLRDHGVDSMGAARLWLAVTTDHGVEVPIGWFGDGRPLRELVAALDEAVGPDGATAEDPGAEAAPGERHGTFPPTPLQQAHLFASCADLGPDAVGCHLYREFTVADLDTDRLVAAWRRMVDTHDALRMTLDLDGRAEIAETAPRWTVAVHRPAAADAGRHLEQVRRRLAHRRVEPGAALPFAIEVTLRPDAPAVVHLGISALVTDGFGITLLLDQWAACYADPSHLPVEARTTVRACLDELDAGRSTPAHAAALDRAVERLSDLPDGPALFAPAHTGPDDLPGMERRSLDDVVDGTVWSALRRLAVAWEVSPTALVLTAFSETLARHGADGPFSLTLTTSDRVRLPAAAAEVVGPFTATSLFVAEPDAGRAQADAARRTNEQLWAGLRDGVACGVTVQRELRSRGVVRRPVALPVVFTSMLDALPAGTDGFGGSLTHLTGQTADVALDHQMWERDGALHLHWDVTPERFTGPAPAELFAAFVAALHATAALAGADQRPEPLADLAQAYLVARAGGDPAGCRLHVCHEAGPADPAGLARDLEAALCRTAGRHPVLRDAIDADGRVLRPADPTGRWPVGVVEVADAAAHDAADARVRAAMTARPFPLGRGAHVEVRAVASPARTSVHLAADLALLDARSIRALGAELMWELDGSAAPRTPAATATDATEPQPVPAAERARAGEHWRARLTALPAGPDRATTGPRRRIARELPGAGAALVARAAELGVDADAVLLAAFAGALVGTGPQVGVTVVRLPAAGGPVGERTRLSWVAASAGCPDERARTYHRTLAEDADADAVPGLREMRRRAMRDGVPATFPVVYTSLFDLADEPLPAGVTRGPWCTSTPDVALDAIATLDGDDLTLCLDVAADGYPDGAAEQLLDDYATALPAALPAALPTALPTSSPAVTPGTEPMTAAERDRILHAWNDTDRPFAADRTLGEVLSEQAALRPDATAVVTRTGSVTFGELDARAERIAHLLREQGAGRGSVVGVRIRRGPVMVAAVLGVLKVGGTYLPLEPYLPADRVAGMAADAGASFVLTTSDTAPLEPVPDGLRPILVDATAHGPVPAPQPCPAAVDDTAYIIFTSGSTGRPKGVAVAHRAALNLLAWAGRTFGIGPADRGLCVTSLGFDLSVFDLFGVLGAGASLYVADEDEQRDPGALLEVLLTRDITFWNSAPTTLAQVGPLMAPYRGEAGTRSLRLVFLSGDYTPLPLPDVVRAVFPRADMISLGGATEATVWSNWFRIGAVDPQWRSIPYGYPIDNARYHVLDEHGEPCPVGEEGDLYIGGVCLAQGYVGRPELTAERFVRDPFSDDPAERLYATGDRASYRPDGCLVFLGRRDNQVKIRGHRVELGEIEHVVRAHDDVDDVVVLARPDDCGDTKVVAYVLPADGASPTVRDVRTRAAASLPGYMVPNIVAFVDGFPATSNGKLDRGALPWPVAGGAVLELVGRPDEPETPETPEAPAAAAPVPVPCGTTLDQLVDEVSGLFARKLGVERVGPDEDLWDLGATSFTIVQVSAELQRDRGIRVPVAALLADPTVASVARHLLARSGDAAAPAATPTRAAAPATPAPAAPAPAAAAGPAPGTAPSEVDFFDPDARARFKAGRHNRRPTGPGETTVALPREELGAWHGWRGTRREFADRPVGRDALGRLLGLLAPVTTPDGAVRRLYPSAGDTYSVQVYLHVTAGGVEGIDGGVFHLDPDEHVLRRIGDGAALDRSAHFAYNRAVADGARFTVLLVGQRRGIEPLYGEQAGRYLACEAGAIGQLLMSGQAAAGLGLCPIGAMAAGPVAAALGLDDGHVFLQALLGGVVEHDPAADGLVPPFDRPSAAGPAPAVAGGAPRAAEAAVVGMALRLPGAEDTGAFWNGLLSGYRGIGPVPEARRDEVGQAPPGAYFDVIDRFDNLLFRIAHDDAAELDPQTRLLLETVWRAIDDTGRTPESLRSLGRVGVFVGAMWHDHQHQGADLWRGGGRARIAATASEMANRVSHCFDFRGPSLAVDTSCSSSLSALDLAMRSLRRGECEVAVVGAVNLLAHPYHARLLADLDLVASEPRPAFDADGSGWSPGEGCGVVVLRPADAAGATGSDGGDVVHGVIEATWTGHTGRCGRYGAPSVDAMVSAMRAVLDEAGREPSDVDYVECAAAGAGLADAAEIEAVGRVWADTGTVVPIGTVKPNTGHLEAASGMTQLVKALLQLRHRRIAPTLLAADPSPLLEWDRLPVSVVDRACPLTTRAPDGRPTVLVTALGATGSIGHAVLRAPEAVRREAASARAAVPYLVPLTAPDERSLAAAAERLHDHLLDLEALAPVAVADVAATLQHGRTHLGARLMIRCRDLAGLLAGLRAAAAGRAAHGVTVSSPDPALADVASPTTDPDEAAAAWSDGYTVDFAALAHEPWRRVALPGTAFGGDRHRLPAAGLPTVAATVGADVADLARPTDASALAVAPDLAAGHAVHQDPPPPTPEPTVDPTDPGTAGTDPARARLERIERYLVERYAEASGIPVERLHATVALENYGLTSRIVARLDEALRRDVGVIPRTLFFAHPDLAGIARDLAEWTGPWDDEQDGRDGPAPMAAAAGQEPPPAAPGPEPSSQHGPQHGPQHGLQHGPQHGSDGAGPLPSSAAGGHGADDAPTADEDAVAIVGIAGRYPQAPDLDTFWANLLAGRDAVTPLPAERARPGWPTDLMWGGYIADVDRFDSLLFGISPREAARMDPQERLFLEVVWEALDDAGYPRARLADKHDRQVGVFAGVMYNEYPYLAVERSRTGEPTDAGAPVAGIANRVSYVLDLHGPSMAVDTMCSSSLTSLHLAVQSLLRGECSAAIAGGVNLALHPHKFVQQQRLQMSAPGHRCRSFGAGGDGFVPAEGVGAVLLKPLRAALADGDRIHAVVRGTAVNHGGRTNGYMVPSPVAQGELVATAIRRAGIDPSTLGYVEAHGTGTELGDPIEVDGLRRAFAGAVAPGGCAIGSVKSGIGHAEAAAGIAGLTKVVLQMRHRMLAPTLHTDRLNDGVDWDAAPVRVIREAEPWERGDGPRRAGISSFGAGGANAHVVLEEPPPAAAAAAPAARHAAGPPQVFVLSARDGEHLVLVARRLAEALGAATREEPASAVRPELDLATLLTQLTDIAEGRMPDLPSNGSTTPAQLSRYLLDGLAHAEPGPAVDRPSAADVAWTLQVGREPLRERLAVVAADLGSLVDALTRFVDGAPSVVLRGRAPSASETPRGLLRPGGTGRDELDRLARHWVAGGTVEWDALHGRPGRVVGLPSYPFERVRHWIDDGRDEPVSAAPVPSPASRAVPLRERTWAEDVTPAGGDPVPTGTVLCLTGPRTAALADALEASLGTLARIDPEAAPERVRAEVDAAVARGPVGWLDLSDLDRAADDPARARVRRDALQALVAARHGSGLRVLQVVRGLLDLPGPVPSPAGARVASVVRRLSAEHPAVVATVLDVDLDTDPRDIAAEWTRTEAPGEVVLRAGRRFRPHLAPLVEDAAGPVRLDPDLSYVVTGATGGLGSLVAGRLVDRGARKLLLLGHRTPGPAAVGAAERLRAAGAEVVLVSGSLTDRQWLAGSLASARALGPIGGVVHCAGAAPAGRRPFVHTGADDLDAVAEPKVDGLELLAELCEGDAPRFWVLFSSLSALAPRLAAGVLGYSAANAFGDLFAAHQNLTGRPGFRSVAWPTWSETGMGAGDPTGCDAGGLGALTDEQGLDVFERVLALPDGCTQVVPFRPVGGSGAIDPQDVLAFGRPTGPAVPPADVTAVLAVPAAEEPPAGPDTDLVLRRVAEIVGATLGIPADALDRTATFGELGAESVVLLELLARLETETGRPLEPGTLFENPTTASLAAHLAPLFPAPEPAEPVAPVVPVAPAVPAVEAPAPAAVRGAGPLRVAVIGLACRFPGAPDSGAFWDLLSSGRCAVGDVPAARWDTGVLYRPGAAGYSTSRWGAFVDDLEGFDAARFGMSAAEAAALDPAIRMILETSVSCLADAGYADDEVAGREVGVFVGTRLSAYRQRAARTTGAAATVGSDQNFAAARVAHQLDLHGPNLVVDTACSSSLVAVQLACRSLLAGESELALAGGADVLLDEEPYLDFSAAGALSPSGLCRTFDESADGFVPGEGAGMLLLKPLDRALADGDRVLAVIDAVAVNNDGRTMGLTAPNPVAQARVVRRALADAGVTPDRVGMIEAHGTATRLGDPIELRALTDVFREGTDRSGFCAIGSVKSNIGHLLSAAGVAGVIKAVLSVEHGTVPPTLHCDTPNPRFDFAASPFRPAREAVAWPDGPRIAGVSAFGLGGTNAHLVLSAPDAPRPDGVVVREPLPAPVFRREWHWLDRPGTPVVAGAAPEPPGPPPATPVAPAASLLDLQLTDAQSLAQSTDASANGASQMEVQPW